MEDRQLEELESRIARGIAPIKKEHIRQNTCKTREEKAAAVVDVETVGEDSKQASKLAPKKKSRRAFKKVQQEGPYTASIGLLRHFSYKTASACVLLMSAHWPSGGEREACDKHLPPLHQRDLPLQ